MLGEGAVLTTGAGDALRIIKSVRGIERGAQGGRELSAMRITAMLDACHKAAFVRSRAIIKESAALSAIYRAAGATIQAVDADFPVPRFSCLIGGTPSFHIARVLQEEGGVVHWKAGKLKFMRLGDLFKQKAAANLPNNASDDVESGFLERHEIPSFFSLAAGGGFVMGDLSKPREMRFAPHTNVQRLRNMSQCLVQRKVMKIDYASQLCAGDLIEFVGSVPLCIITAAHVFENGEDGSNQYTRLWLGALQ
ncbi:MAG: hypothetical protein I8H91_11080 [Burkholderiales bacterium]|nr:hypothetical protein [Burkholderiales bacterium]